MLAHTCQACVKQSGEKDCGLFLSHAIIPAIEDCKYVLVVTYKGILNSGGAFETASIREITSSVYSGNRPCKGNYFLLK